MAGVNQVISLGIGSPASIRRFLTFGLWQGYPTPTFALVADFDRDGLFETSLNPYVQDWTRGLNVSRGLDRDGVYRTAEVNMELANSDARFSPEYSASPLYGKVSPGLPIRLICSFGSELYYLWSGYLKDINSRNRGQEVGTAEWTAEDLLGALEHYGGLDVTASGSRRTDQGISAILLSAGLTAIDYVLATGQQTMAVHFTAGDQPIPALMECVRSEMGGFLWVDGVGRTRFEDRQSRLGSTVDDTWGDGTNVVPSWIEYMSNVDNLLTRVQVTVTPWKASPGATKRRGSRWSRGADTDDSPVVKGSSSITIYSDAGAPGSGWTAPVANDDYTGNAARDGSGADKTAQITVTTTEVAGGRLKHHVQNADASDVYLTKFGVQGPWYIPVDDQSKPTYLWAKTIPGQKVDGALSLTLNFVDDTPAGVPKARDYAYHLLRLGRYPIPQLRLGFDWNHDDISTAMLEAEIGRLIAYDDTDQGVWGAYVNENWYVEGLQTEPRVPGRPKSVVLLQPSWAYRNLDAILYDTFERSNGALGKTDNNVTWADATNVAIVSNKAKSSTTSLKLPNLALGKTDLVTEVDLAALTAAEATAIGGLIYRYSNTSNYWAAYIDKSAGQIKLVKTVAGVATTVASAAYTLPDNAEMQVIVQGNRHRVRIRDSTTRMGKTYLDATDSALNSNTKCGVILNNTSTITLEDYFAEGLN